MQRVRVLMRSWGGRWLVLFWCGWDGGEDCGRVGGGVGNVRLTRAVRVWISERGSGLRE